MDKKSSNNNLNNTIVNDVVTSLVQTESKIIPIITPDASLLNSNPIRYITIDDPSTQQKRFQHIEDNDSKALSKRVNEYRLLYIVCAVLTWLIFFILFLHVFEKVTTK